MTKMMRSSKIKTNFIGNHSIGLAAIFVLILGMISVPTTTLAAHDKQNDKQSDSSSEVPVHMVVTVKPRHNGGQVPGAGGNRCEGLSA